MSGAVVEQTENPGPSLGRVQMWRRTTFSSFSFSSFSPRTCWYQFRLRLQTLMDQGRRTSYTKRDSYIPGRDERSHVTKQARRDRNVGLGIRLDERREAMERVFAKGRKENEGKGMGLAQLTR